MTEGADSGAAAAAAADLAPMEVTADPAPPTIPPSTSTRPKMPGRQLVSAWGVNNDASSVSEAIGAYLESKGSTLLFVHATSGPKSFLREPGGFERCSSLQAHKQLWCKRKKLTSPLERAERRGLNESKGITLKAFEDIIIEPTAVIGVEAPEITTTEHTPLDHVKINKTSNPDADILAEVFQSSEGEKWNTATNWLQSSVPLRHWHGVDTLRGQVTSLDLSQNGLLGGTKAIEAIRKLTALRKLDLQRSNLGRCELPSDFCVSFPSLTSLNLMQSNLSGDFPMSLFNLMYEKLDFYNFQGNQFANLEKGTIERVLVMKYTNLKDQRHIDLSSQDLKGELHLGLIQLKVGKQCRIDLHGNKGFTLPDNIGDLDESILLHCGRNLVLSNCSLSGTVPASLGKLKLNRLDLSKNGEYKMNGRFYNLGKKGLTGKLTEELVDQLFEMDRFDLRNNRFRHPAKSIVAFIIRQYTNLKDEVSFDFSNRNLSGVIPSGLLRLKGAGVPVHLRDNKGLTLPTDMHRMSEVTKLELSEINLQGTIPDSIGEMTKLEVLNLHQNKLTGELPESIGRLVNLKELRMQQNQLTGLIPSSIGGCTALRRLDLSRNGEYEDYGHVFNKGLKGFEGRLPTEVCELKSLQVLDLSENKLIGLIPEDFGNLTELKVCDLAFNSFWGKIPPSLQNLSKLKQCYLNHNRLSGPLPLLLVDMKVKGCTVKLNDNKGFLLPENIDEIKVFDRRNRPAKLTLLDLSNCSLSGTFPWQTIAKLVDLEMLVMHGNNFSGIDIQGQMEKVNPNFPFLKSLARIDLRKSNLRVAGTDKDLLKRNMPQCRVYC